MEQCAAGFVGVESGGGSGEGKKWESGGGVESALKC